MSGWADGCGVLFCFLVGCAIDPQPRNRRYSCGWPAIADPDLLTIFLVERLVKMIPEMNAGRRRTVTASDVFEAPPDQRSCFLIIQIIEVFNHRRARHGGKLRGNANGVETGAVPWLQPMDGLARNGHALELAV